MEHGWGQPRLLVCCMQAAAAEWFALSGPAIIKRMGRWARSEFVPLPKCCSRASILIACPSESAALVAAAAAKAAAKTIGSTAAALTTLAPRPRPTRLAPSLGGLGGLLTLDLS